MKTSRQVNKWLGFDGGYIQLPNTPNRYRVISVMKRNSYWLLRTLAGHLTVRPKTTIEHAVRQETITLK